MADIDDTNELSLILGDIIKLKSSDMELHNYIFFIDYIDDIKLGVIREDGGELTVVEGDGVVGQSPVLEPGEDFSYNSYHVTESNAEVSGAFFGTTAAGDKVRVRMPDFRLELPDWV